MRKVAFVLCLASIAGMAYSVDGKLNFKKFMSKEVGRVQKAFNNRDADYFEKIAADDFVDNEMGTTMKRADAMKEMRSMMSTSKSIHCHITLLRTTQNGDVGTVYSHGHWVIITKPNGPKDKSHRMVMSGDDKETWVRVGKVWKIQKLDQVGQSKMTMDGKPYNPNAGGGH